jgi:hypothetical protein
MYRARIETLEKRQMFAADNLSDVVAAYVLGNCPNWFMDPNPPPIVGEPHNQLAGDSADSNDLHLALSRTETVGKDESITVGAAIDVPTHNPLSLSFEKTSLTDGTSNTMMFAFKSAASDPVANLIQRGPQADGIIAILIGLAADPADANGGKFAVEDPALAGQSLLATTYGRGMTSQITHDAEFEGWASVSRFERGYLSLELENVLVSSVRGEGSQAAESISRVVAPNRILHEDNEFSFPRV